MHVGQEQGIQCNDKVAECGRMNSGVLSIKNLGNGSNMGYNDIVRLGYPLMTVMLSPDDQLLTTIYPTYTRLDNKKCRTILL